MLRRIAILLLLPATSNAAELSVEELQYVADRSPSVFDTF
jgi:hypothetical protein